ncbi:MAG: hypothetical protein AAGM22_24235 [Acidobacteriota bacterium]
MPTHIYELTPDDRENETLAFLEGEDDWCLSTQIGWLRRWLREHRELPKGRYVADIGYSVRKGAYGGGEILTVEMLELLLAVGMEIYFSEYASDLPPGLEEE